MEDANRQPGTTLEVGTDSATMTQEHSLQEAESVEQGTEQRVVQQERQTRFLEDQTRAVARIVPHGGECGVSYDSGCMFCFDRTWLSDPYCGDN